MLGVATGGRGSPSPAVIPQKGLLRLEQLSEEEHAKLCEELKLPVYLPKRNKEVTKEDPARLPQTFRPKDRMRTNSVALVMCLNIGVDPPDVVKVSPCAKMECWIDPNVILSKNPTCRPIENIGQALQKQYERWQARARYKQALDPTLEDLRKLCTGLRKSAKDERVLFHFNGHGVPKPTHNGEIWVFNKQFTQYIPVSLFDLQQWMGSPSIYVFDCSAAGILLSKFNNWTVDGQAATLNGVSPNVENCIQLAACRADETLPMDPELPADMFTACLTTPIKIALKCYITNSSFKLVPGLTCDVIDRIPGSLGDRRTMLGELNWIFTAITDTIAWNVLPKALFQKLFRQDLLVASLFRNFLLAERVMRIYDCNPQSSPALPKTFHHPMWQAWDLALDNCLRQLPDMLQKNAPFQQSQFFADQLTAFEVWLRFSSLEPHPSPPEQLPIVLQVLLSQVHRTRALELLARFLDLGPWAVSQALSVGIFPYILKLLQSQARELRPLLVFIWAKILAVDCTYQADLVRDDSHKYFLNSLQDTSLPMNYRTMAAFILSCLCANGHHRGQKICMQSPVVAICTELLSEGNVLSENLKKWLCILLGRLWDGYCDAKWLGIRSSTHEKLVPLLNDPSPEVRAAAVFALGTLLNSQTERSTHADVNDNQIGKFLLNYMQWDSSPLVRQELIAALQWLLCVFDTQYVTAAYEALMEERRLSDSNSDTQNSPMTIKHNRVKSATTFLLTSIVDGVVVRTTSTGTGPPHQGIIAEELRREKMRKTSSGISLSSQLNSGLLLPHTVNSQHAKTWKFLTALATVDPHEKVSEMTKSLVKMYKKKADSMLERRSSRDHNRSNHSSVATSIVNSSSACHSEPSSPSGKNSFLGCSGDEVDGATLTPLSRSSSMYHNVRINDSLRSTSPVFSHSRVVRPRKNFDHGLPQLNERGPTKNRSGVSSSDSQHDSIEPVESSYLLVANPVVKTDFLEILTRQFQKPCLDEKEPNGDDRDSLTSCKTEYRFMRNATVRRNAANILQKDAFKGLAKYPDEQQFSKRMSSPPTSVVFHPFEPLLYVADSSQVVVFDTDRMIALKTFMIQGPPKLSSMVLVNPHHERCLLFSATNDGAIRAWSNCSMSQLISQRKSDDGDMLVTAFNCMLDAPEIQTPLRCSGILLEWDQAESHLITCGDMRVVRIWDMNQERRITDISLDTEESVRCLAVDKNAGGSRLAIGMRDGTVKLYDRRRASKSPVLSTRDHCGQVVGIHLDVERELLTSASVAGDIRSWPLVRGNNNNSSKVITLPQQDLTCMSVHPYFPGIIACGTQGNNVVLTEDGSAPQIIKPHQDWFSNQRPASVNALAFHPFKMSLATACQDLVVSLYQKKRN